MVLGERRAHFARALTEVGVVLGNCGHRIAMPELLLGWHTRIGRVNLLMKNMHAADISADGI